MSNDAQGQPEIVKYNSNAGSNNLTGNLSSDHTAGQATMLTTSSDIACLYVYDGLDNPVGLLTDFASNVVTSSFDPYGVGTLNGSGNGVGQNPYTFHSGIQDRASGLVKFGIRWYNPTTGTWTQQDTLDAPLDPTNGNRYVFVGGDPINGLDPTGQIGGGCTPGSCQDGGQEYELPKDVVKACDVVTVGAIIPGVDIFDAPVEGPCVVVAAIDFFQ